MAHLRFVIAPFVPGVPNEICGTLVEVTGFPTAFLN